MRWALMATLIIAAAACSRPPAPETKTETVAIAPPPAQLADPAFKDCTWEAVTGGGVTINAYACPTSKLVGDAALPGIVQESAIEGGATARGTVVQVFAKAPDAPIEAVLGAVRAASPGSETCAFALAREGWAAPGEAIFELWPTGAAKDKYDGYLAGKTEEVMFPCGPLGPGEAGAHTFKILEGAPDKVVMLSWPSDLPSYDYASLRPAS